MDTRSIHIMADKAPKSLKLKFKGEKSKKKRKYDEGDDIEASSSSRGRRHDAQDNGGPEWVHAEQATEIRGPTFIFHPSDPSPLCVSFDATRNRITLHPLEKLEDGGGSILDRTPSEVAQVWVTTRVAGAGTINLRTGTGEGKFLSCDKHGLVAADREARGPQEEWTPVVLEDGMVAFMNVYEKYLGIDEVAGGQLTLRGDSDTVGFQERFYVKIQNKYKLEAHEEERKKGGALDLPSTDEKSTKCVLDHCPLSGLGSSSPCSAIFQAWGAGRSVVSKDDRKEVREPLLFHRLFVTDALPKA